MRRVSVFVGIALLAAACGGGGSNTQSTQSAGASPPTSSPTGSGSTANCIDLSAGPVFTVAMKDIQFHPKCFKARSSQSIHLVNQDSVTHNFTIPNTQVDVDVQGGQFFNGESAGLAPGTYQFFCKFHQSSGMTGTVIVLSG